MMVNDQKISSIIESLDVSWIMQGYKFYYNFYVIELDGYDMIWGLIG